MAEEYDRLEVTINKDAFKKAFIILGSSNRMIELPSDREIKSIINIPIQEPI